MRNPAVDAYIAKSAAFARPILKRLRLLVHKADPKVEETIKWGVPHFEHAGIVAGMAAFKQHVAFGFWSEKLIRERLGPAAARMFPAGAERGMGGRKYRSLADLPPDALVLRAVKAAVALNEAGERPVRARSRKPPPKAPPDLAAALGKIARARATFAKLTPGQQREYVDWLLEAKQAATRERRLAQAVQWLAEGKQRYWKYQGC
ncbi:MAG TPA: YdeI/OmpD-associated family protein [Steroidobacteraceae bacterium]|nr:YdeI/OmpD-associated family protein [Steroidobacteraceae bacterium]